MLQITDITTAFYAVRHNNYPNDPMLTNPGCNQSLSKWVAHNCTNDPFFYTSPFFAIASRMDLVPRPVPNEDPSSMMQPHLFGMIDGKVSTARMLADPANLTVFVQNGPTTVQQAPLDFNAFYASHPHAKRQPALIGTPNVIDYKPVRLQPPQAAGVRSRRSMPASLRPSRPSRAT